MFVAPRHIRRAKERKGIGIAERKTSRQRYNNEGGGGRADNSSCLGKRARR